jgi:signal peptidase I
MCPGRLSWWRSPKAAVSVELNFDQPWKIAALIGLLAFLRIIWGLWRKAPSRKFMVELLDSGLIAFILVFVIIRPFVVQAFSIPTGSMEPTIVPGDRVLVNRFIYRLRPPQRGDIIVFDAPSYALLERGETQKDFIKRLIGLPGDEIMIRHDQGVYVNGRLLREAPGVPPPDYDWPLDEWGRAASKAYRVPKGSYFVLGDNRINSHDSHRWRDNETGLPHPELPQGRVLGKAMVRFWPPRRVGLLSDRSRVYVP